MKINGTTVVQVPHSITAAPGQSPLGVGSLLGGLDQSWLTNYINLPHWVVYSVQSGFPTTPSSFTKVNPQRYFSYGSLRFVSTVSYETAIMFVMTLNFLQDVNMAGRLVFFDDNVYVYDGDSNLIIARTWNNWNVPFSYLFTQGQHTINIIVTNTGGGRIELVMWFNIPWDKVKFVPILSP